MWLGSGCFVFIKTTYVVVPCRRIITMALTKTNTFKMGNSCKFGKCSVYTNRLIKMYSHDEASFRTDNYDPSWQM